MKFHLTKNGVDVIIIMYIYASFYALFDLYSAKDLNITENMKG